MRFVCIICQTEAPRADGRPVDDSRWPSWRCADSEACAARFLGGLEASTDAAVRKILGA